VQVTELLQKLLAGCGPPTSPALTGGLLRLAKELSWHSTDSPCMTLSLAVMRRLREAADLGHFSDAGSPLTVQAADLAHHMLHTFGEGGSWRCTCLLICCCCCYALPQFAQSWSTTTDRTCNCAHKDTADGLLLQVYAWFVLPRVCCCWLFIWMASTSVQVSFWGPYLSCLASLNRYCLTTPDAALTRLLLCSACGCGGTRQHHDGRGEA
jgi:hypothetical protein